MNPNTSTRPARIVAVVSSRGDVRGVEVARAVTTAIWHMLTKREPFAPGRPPVAVLVA